MATMNASALWLNALEFPFLMYEATHNFTAKGKMSEANITLQDVRNKTGTASYSMQIWSCKVWLVDKRGAPSATWI